MSSSKPTGLSPENPTVGRIAILVENKNAVIDGVHDCPDSGGPTPRRSVELVRRTYRLIDEMREARPEALDDAFRDYLDQGFELRPPDSYPEGAQVFRGRAGLKRWIATTKEVWDEWRLVPQRFIEADDRVVVLVRVVAQGGLSGVRLDRETAHIWTVADGRVTRCEVYLDRAEALAAAGVGGAGR